jgi:hypothetical protein
VTLKTPLRSLPILGRWDSAMLVHRKTCFCHGDPLALVGSNVDDLGFGAGVAKEALKVSTVGGGDSCDFSDRHFNYRRIDGTHIIRSSGPEQPRTFCSLSARTTVLACWLGNFHAYRSWESTMIVMYWPKGRAVGRVTLGRACFAVRADCQKVTSRPRALAKTNIDRFSRLRFKIRSMALPRRTQEVTGTVSIKSGSVG